MMNGTVFGEFQRGGMKDGKRTKTQIAPESIGEAVKKRQLPYLISKFRMI